MNPLAFSRQHSAFLALCLLGAAQGLSSDELYRQWERERRARDQEADKILASLGAEARIQRASAKRARKAAKRLATQGAP